MRLQSEGFNGYRAGDSAQCARRRARIYHRDTRIHSALCPRQTFENEVEVGVLLLPFEFTHPMAGLDGEAGNLLGKVTRYFVGND